MKKLFLITLFSMLILCSTAFAIDNGEYDMYLMTLNMDRIVCSSDIGAKFIVNGDQWTMGDFKGRLEDNGDFVKLYLTQECRFSPCVGEIFVGYYDCCGNGWTADLQTRIVLTSIPVNYDAWCVGFSPRPSWCL